MIHIEGHELWRGGEKIGYLEGEKIYSHEAHKLGWVDEDHIYDHSGRKIAWIEGNHAETPDGSKMELDDIHEHVEGGAISGALRTAIYLFLGD